MKSFDVKKKKLANTQRISKTKMDYSRRTWNDEPRIKMKTNEYRQTDENVTRRLTNKQDV